MVARALLLRPRILLADEPVSMVDASLRATILDSVYTLNRTHGISVIYITHDLTTAYQVSDNIIVLYRGSVAEAGSVEQVIKQPKHPYTQLLVQSIPRPDPRKLWGDVPRRCRGPGRGGRLQVCRPLPVRHGRVPGGRPAASSHRSPPRGQLLPVSRFEGTGRAGHCGSVCAPGRRSADGTGPRLAAPAPRYPRVD